MPTSLLGISIIDWAIVGLLVISFVIGVLMGLRKSIDGIVGLNIIILLSSVGSFFIINVSPIATLSVYDQISTKIETTVFGTVDIFSNPAYYDEGNLVILIDEEEGTYVSIVEAMGGEESATGSAVSSIVNKLISEDTFSNGQTIGNYLAGKLTQIAFMGILFVIFGIILRIVLGVLTKILKRKLEENEGLKPVDKVFGGVVNLLNAFGIVLVVFLTYSLVSNMEMLQPVNDIIDQSYIGKFIMDLFGGVTGNLSE
jgi:uncharacterized membrane protein required for colicin V production